MERILLGETRFAELVQKNKVDLGLARCYAYLFVPWISAEHMKSALPVEAEDVVIGRTKGALIKSVKVPPVLRKFQVSYKAGGRWGSRVVMAESQEQANQMVKDEIAATVGARPVKA